jgi:hypothetical protein
MGALADATAFVSVALAAIQYGEEYGPEEHVLQVGVGALHEVYNRLDDAERQMARVGRAQKIAKESAL